MGAQIVDDKEDLSLRAPHETLEEAQKDAGVQGTIVDRQPELAAVRQARNHALREARSRTSDDRRLASRREAAAIVGLVRKPGLIGPLDLGFSRPLPAWRALDSPSSATV